MGDWVGEGEVWGRMGRMRFNVTRKASSYISSRRGQALCLLRVMVPIHPFPDRVKRAGDEDGNGNGNGNGNAQRVGLCIIDPLAGLHVFSRGR